MSTGRSRPATLGLPAAAADLSPVVAVARVALVVLAAIALGVSAQLVAIGGLQHRAAQQGAFDRLRKELAEGTAPLGQADTSGHLLALGTPLAVIRIPAIGVHQVVLEGTTGGVLMSGPGHSRSSPLPGQAGTSVIFGRRASYGGPFSRLSELRPGQTVIVTTGEGVSTYRVIAHRRGGDLGPPRPVAGQGRLLLVTADGTPFVPSGVLRVDADLVTPALAGAPSALPATAIAHSEQIMAGDPSTLWTLVFWLQALILVAMAGVWSWSRWGHHQTWIVLLPPVMLMSFFASDQFIKLLPNLL